MRSNQLSINCTHWCSRKLRELSIKCYKYSLCEKVSLNAFLFQPVNCSVVCLLSKFAKDIKTQAQPVWYTCTQFMVETKLGISWGIERDKKFRSLLFGLLLEDHMKKTGRTLVKRQEKSQKWERKLAERDGSGGLFGRFLCSWLIYLLFFYV